MLSAYKDAGEWREDESGESGRDSWIIVEDPKGMALTIDSRSGEVVALSSRKSRDVDRWKEMPSLAKYTALTSLDLHKSRYITELHDSVGLLTNLRSLNLTLCERLTTLPQSIGNLKNLQEVRVSLSVGKCGKH